MTKNKTPCRLLLQHAAGLFLSAVFLFSGNFGGELKPAVLVIVYVLRVKALQYPAVEAICVFCVCPVIRTGFGRKERSRLAAASCVFAAAYLCRPSTRRVTISQRRFCGAGGEELFLSYLQISSAARSICGCGADMQFPVRVVPYLPAAKGGAGHGAEKPDVAGRSSRITSHFCGSFYQPGRTCIRS